MWVLGEDEIFGNNDTAYRFFNDMKAKKINLHKKLVKIEREKTDGLDMDQDCNFLVQNSDPDTIKETLAFTQRLMENINIKQ